MKTVLMIVALLAQTPATVPANLIGTWALVGFRGAAPLGVRHERALCGAMLLANPPGTPDGSGEQISSMGTVDGVIVITASPGGLVIERRFTGTAGAGTITHTYPNDGSLSAGATLGERSISGKFAVLGPALNVDTTVTRGKEAQTGCSVREAFEVNGSGMLQITATASTGLGTSSVQTYIRKTSSSFTHEEKIR
jgi:hypothetical protein